MAVRTLTGEKLEKELARLEAMKEYEYTYEACSHICGIDEAGRGPLAGPVVAAAVILPKDCQILYLNDSKKLSQQKREFLYEEITKKPLRMESVWQVRDALMRLIFLEPPMKP